MGLKWSEIAQSCPTFCNPVDCRPPGSSVHGISQARTLEWVAISFSRGSSWPRDWTQASCIGRWIFTTEHQRSPTLTCSWASSSNTNLFYSKVLNASCNLLNTVLKVKNRVIVWVGNGCKYIGCLPSKSWCSLVAMVLLLLPSIVRGYCTILSAWEKIKIQNLKYIYYWLSIAFTSSWNHKVVIWTILNKTVYQKFKKKTLGYNEQI